MCIYIYIYIYIYLSLYLFIYIFIELNVHIMYVCVWYYICTYTHAIHDALHMVASGPGYLTKLGPDVAGPKAPNTET